jgi:hypothetical protein
LTNCSERQEYYEEAPDKMSSADDKSKITTTYKAAKDMGFDSFKAFLESYGLRVWDTDGVEEGKAIMRAMGYNVS